MKIKIIPAVILIICLFTAGATAAAKTVFIPTEFASLGLDWDMTRSYESANFVVFWGSIVGTDPANYPDTTLRFNPQAICDMLEAVYTKYITDIQFCSDDPSKNLGKYKIIIMMNDTWSSPNGPTGWAYGSAYDDTIGAMWVHPQATADGYVISHEFAHTLQSMIHIQENPAGGYMYWEPAGFFWECHANFMRAQMYPEAAYAFDMPRWLATSMFHWSSTRHHYDSFRPLFVLQELYGINMVNRLWKESVADEHPLVTLKRLQGWTQAQLNDFMYGYAQRETVYDYPVNGFGTVIKTEMTRLNNQEPHYLWRLYAMLDRVAGYSDRYIVPDEFAPQDYGYNMIPLYPANVSLPVCVKFKGHTEANTYTGWRYGIVSVTTGGVPRYGDMYPDNEKEFAFQPLADESSWFLVVMGAPVTHTSYVWEPGWPKIKRYPYEIRLSNAAPEGWQANFRSDIRAKYAGHAHTNGGGWIANSATVAASVYVGPRAVVLGNSNISGAVSISGTAWVENAVVGGNVIIDRNAKIYSGNISQNAHVTDNALLYNCTVSGSITAKQDTYDWGSTFSGASIVGGDAEITSATTDGVYLQCPHTNNGRAENDGKGATDVSNIDVNTMAVPYADSVMQFTGGCVVSSPTATPTQSRTATPTCTGTMTITGSPSASASTSATASMSPSRTVTNTQTWSATASMSPSMTNTETWSATASMSPSMTNTETWTRTATSTVTYTEMQSPTITPTITETRTGTPTDFTVTSTATVTDTLQLTPTNTLVPGPSASATASRSQTPPDTITLTATMSQTVTPTNTWTSTVPPVLTPTFTPTTAGTAVAFEITGMPSYPNPYNAKTPLNVRFNTTRDLINIMFRLYTASFRLVLKENEGAYLQGDRTMQVAAANLAGFSNGIYYYNIEGTDNNGKKARGRIGTVIILK